jgi:hypothetical protein
MAQLCTFLICLAITSHAQQTVLNVPSVLDRSKVYADLDGNLLWKRFVDRRL